jgi:hypothetical protein
VEDEGGHDDELTLPNQAKVLKIVTRFGKDMFRAHTTKTITRASHEVPFAGMQKSYIF